MRKEKSKMCWHWRVTTACSHNLLMFSPALSFPKTLPDTLRFPLLALRCKSDPHYQSRLCSPSHPDCINGANGAQVAAQCQHRGCRSEGNLRVFRLYKTQMLHCLHTDRRFKTKEQLSFTFKKAWPRSHFLSFCEWGEILGLISLFKFCFLLLWERWRKDTTCF